VTSSKAPHLLVALLALAACKKTVDTKGFEKTIAAKVTELGLTPGKISCPSGIEGKKGAEFTCKVEIEKTTYDLIVTITSVETSNAQMDTRWAKGPAVISKKIAANAPKALAEAFGTTVTVDCGTEPLLFLESSKAKCKLTSGKASSTLLLSFDDKLEVTGWELSPPLLGRKKLEELLTPSVAEKTSPNVKVDCGPEDLITRPADGNVWCGVTDGAQTAKIRVAVTPELKVDKWEIATPP
jgi:hypothetical protein